MKRIIAYLYRKYCEKKVEQKEPIPLEKLSKEEQQNLFRRCKIYAEDDLFVWLMETVVSEIEFKALYSSSHIPIETTEARLHLERINGIGDFHEKIKQLASQVPLEEGVPFDKYAAI